MELRECPYSKPALRAGLPELPARMKAMPVDERGYPVPFFVGWIDGKPEFRGADARKLKACKLAGLCWVCGQALEETFAFVIGPMCTITRTTAEPPSHLECADFSVKGCPFLSKPQMERREDESFAALSVAAPGESIRRNPGVSAVWVTNFYKTFADGRGGELIEVGPPDSVTWWREGRAATRLEVQCSIEEGLPLLWDKCESDQERRELDRQVARMCGLLPGRAT